MNEVEEHVERFKELTQQISYHHERVVRLARLRAEEVIALRERGFTIRRLSMMLDISNGRVQQLLDSFASTDHLMPYRDTQQERPEGRS